MTQLSDGVVERVARAICNRHGRNFDGLWDQNKEWWREAAFAAIAAYEANRETILNQIEQEFPADMGIGRGK